MPAFIRRLDIQLALLVFAGAVALCAYAYAELRNAELAEEALVPSFQGGAHHFALMQREKCIGTAVSDLDFAEDQYQFKLNGRLDVKFGTQSLQPSIEGFASFNSIGQLGGSSFTVRGDKFFLRFGCAELNPISIQMRGVIDGRSFEYKTYVPGPLNLTENSDQTYRLEYLHFGKVVSNYSNLLRHPAVEALKIIPREVEREGEYCAARRAPLDLSLFLPLMKFAAAP